MKNSIHQNTNITKTILRMIFRLEWLVIYLECSIKHRPITSTTYFESDIWKRNSVLWGCPTRRIWCPGSYNHSSRVIFPFAFIISSKNSDAVWAIKIIWIMTISGVRVFTHYQHPIPIIQGNSVSMIVMRVLSPRGGYRILTPCARSHPCALINRWPIVIV